jgi:hypothetical protein
LYRPQIKLTPKHTILSFNQINRADKFDKLISQNSKSLYIMKKWCLKDVKAIVQEFVLVNRYKILWQRVKCYCFSKLILKHEKVLRERKFISKLKHIAYRVDTYWRKKNIAKLLEELYAKKSQLGIYEEELSVLDLKLKVREDDIKKQNEFLVREERRLQNMTHIKVITNIVQANADYVTGKTIDQIKDVNVTTEAKWFGFFNNDDLIKIFQCLKLDFSLLEIDDKTVTNGDYPKILAALVKLCSYTGTKQALYYANKWATIKGKLKGAAEFTRTFGDVFDYKEGMVDINDENFHNLCGYLSIILSNKRIQSYNRKIYIKK